MLSGVSKNFPALAWIRAAVIYAFIDTPWRFKTKSALWKYMGIGLERRRSGNGPTQLRVVKSCNRTLKTTIIGAADTAVYLNDNPFARQYDYWRNQQGLHPKNARRNVARSMAAVMWGMWKNGTDYRSEWVG